MTPATFKSRVAGLKDYSTSPAPGFDAVEDVRAALGETQWEAERILITKLADMYRKPNRWRALCLRCNITHPFQRQAWYDHHFGQGAWLAANALDCAGGMEGRT